MGKKLSRIKVNAMIRMRELGFSVVKVSELFGVSKQTVSDYTVPGRKVRENTRKRDFYRSLKARREQQNGQQNKQMSWQTE